MITMSLSKVSIVLILSLGFLGLAAAAGVGLYPMVGADGGDDSQIHACVRDRDGKVTVVDPDDSCPSGWTSTHWNIQGPQGPEGPPGPKGEDGNLVDPSSIVNVIGSVRALDNCTMDAPFRYEVPLGKALLITDVVMRPNPSANVNSMALITLSGQLLFDISGEPFGEVSVSYHFTTPIKVGSGETLCGDRGGPNTLSLQGSLFASGQLVNSP